MSNQIYNLKSNSVTERQSKKKEKYWMRKIKQKDNQTERGRERDSVEQFWFSGN